MLSIRLRRMGSSKKPFFRVVVTEARSARDSSFVENLGTYNPRSKPAQVEINKARIEHWLKRSSRVSRLTAPEPANHQFVVTLVRFDRELVSLVARHRAASWRKCTADPRGSRS